MNINIKSRNISDMRRACGKAAKMLINHATSLAIGISVACCCLASVNDAMANSKNNKDKFTVVIDPGHGGKDFGAIDNNAREKDINLQVALKVGELVNKKLKDTKVIFTRDDDTFLSLQERANVANNAKADFFISIHTNSVDAKNKNRTSVCGASVYTQGIHKDDANMEVARRENAVIELENGYEQKYSGFDPSKDESYIIFELAQKNNLSESARFAKDVQDNLVKIAGRRDRGVHQAGFWVLWATSMPAVLIELDFICNPDCAKFMTSKDGVEKLADAIFQTIKTYEKNFLQKRKMLAEGTAVKSGAQSKKEADKKTDIAGTEVAPEIENTPRNEISNTGNEETETLLVVASAPESDKRDLTHSNLQATKNQKVARNSVDGRRRRSSSAREASNERNLAISGIVVKSESVGNKGLAKAEVTEKTVNSNPKTSSAVTAKNKSNNKKLSKSSGAAVVASKNTATDKKESKRPHASVTPVGHAGKRKSIKSKTT